MNVYGKYTRGGKAKLFFTCCSREQRVEIEEASSSVDETVCMDVSCYVCKKEEWLKLSIKELNVYLDNPINALPNIRTMRVGIDDDRCL